MWTLLRDTFNSPSWNTSFKFECMSKFLFPPVTEMTSLGNAKCHSFSIRDRTSSALVSLEMRMNYQKNSIMMRIQQLQISRTSGPSGSSCVRAGLMKPCFVLPPGLSDQKRELTPAGGQFNYRFYFPTALHKESNGFMRFRAAKGSTLFPRMQNRWKCDTFTSEAPHESIWIGEFLEEMMLIYQSSHSPL